MSTLPRRVQRRRVKGWRMPEGAVYVGRPTVFGNPFRPSLVDGRWQVRDDNDVTYDVWLYPETSDGAAMQSISLYLDEMTEWFGGRLAYDEALRVALAGLRGRDLVCWCPLDQPCHADVLLELANDLLRSHEVSR